MAKGYAVVVNGKIDMRTVHDTERGAKVNGLCVLFNIMPLDSWSDEFIAQTWERALKRLGVRASPSLTTRVVQVRVEVAP
jgi:hypothetical protein